MKSVLGSCHISDSFQALSPDLVGKYYSQLQIPIVENAFKNKKTKNRTKFLRK